MVKKRKLSVCVYKKKKKKFWGSWSSCGVQGLLCIGCDCARWVGWCSACCPGNQTTTPPPTSPHHKLTQCTLYTLAPPFTGKMFCLFYMVDGTFFFFFNEGPLSGIRVGSAAAAIFQSPLVSNFSTWNSVPNIQLHIERLLSRLEQSLF